MQKPLLPIHPFPARMAPEFALAQVAALPVGSRVLDPMAGSGTVLRVAGDTGHTAIGCDLDPLAVLLARVWTTPVEPTALRAAGEQLLESAKSTDAAAPLPWIDDDPETTAFVAYWFAEPQRRELRRLSGRLSELTGPVADALRVALSRVIITKDHGASLARDVSHSRPHRVRLDNDFPVFDGFARSVKQLAQRLEAQPPRAAARVEQGDARCLADVPDSSIDAVITSPPYLNAIDYLRGHRLSLVWLGYRVGALRQVRAESIGAERGLEPDASRDLATALAEPLGSLSRLPGAEQRMVDRYVLDLHAMLGEVRRVLRPRGRAVFVVGNSCIRGVFISNTVALTSIARRLGLTLVHETERPLPPNRRYLPPPGDPCATTLEKRMRSEAVLTFMKS